MRGCCGRCGEDTNLVDLTLEVSDRRNGNRSEVLLRTGGGEVIKVCVDCRDVVQLVWDGRNLEITSAG